MQRKKLPIGIQTFADIREGGYYYVDKTPHLQQLVDEGKYYFLSRPRRFGKSLLLDTLDCLFAGCEALFEGLYIHNQWDWSQKYPVIRISFNDGVLRTRDELDRRIRFQLDKNRERLGLPASHYEDIPDLFAELIHQAHQQTSQRVVVLIDEYDKPILDNILDAEKAREQREGLKNLYTVLKGADEHLEFVLLTGVSKFSKVSLFSGLNNLNDITLDARFTTICGYTDEDLDSVFAPELPGLDRKKIKDWYNGYRWGGAETTSVYNPFDVLLLLQKRTFEPYWFETATPTFLIDILKERGVFSPQLTAWHSRPALLNQFDVDAISTDALLFQTGYLTVHDIHTEVPDRPLYRLGFPNREVEISLNEALLPALGVKDAITDRFMLRLPRILATADLQGLEEHLKALFAGLPHDWYRNNPIAQYEGHYASVFYSHFAALGVQVTVEDASNYGKVDMAVTFQGQVYLFEFKVVEQVKGSALQQIKDKGYADKYRTTGQQIHLIGVEFSKQQRQVIAFHAETL